MSRPENGGRGLGLHDENGRVVGGGAASLLAEDHISLESGSKIELKDVSVAAGGVALKRALGVSRELEAIASARNGELVSALDSRAAITGLEVLDHTHTLIRVIVLHEFSFVSFKVLGGRDLPATSGVLREVIQTELHGGGRFHGIFLDVNGRVMRCGARSFFAVSLCQLERRRLVKLIRRLGISASWVTPVKETACERERTV